jgi:Zn finger protein HypA/HybF involved in hydrogenase expression
MILTDKVKIKLHNKNINYYKKIINEKLKINDIIEISPYNLLKGSHIKIEVECDECHIIKTLEYRVYYKMTNGNTTKYYCNKCKTIKSQITINQKYGVNNVFQSELIKNEIKRRNLNKYGVEFYSQTKEFKLKVENTSLNRYGVKSYLSLLPNNHDKNHDKLKKTRTLKYSQLFLEKAMIIHGDNFEYLTPYINMATIIKIKCKKCHNIFEQKPKDHIHNKEGCPYCRESKGEKLIKNILITNKINFIQQKTFDNLKYIRALKFDFYLSDYNTCIEYDGEQHHEKFRFEIDNIGLLKRQKRDKIKTEYCLKNNINLIRINLSNKDDLISIINNILK